MAFFKKSNSAVEKAAMALAAAGGAAHLAFFTLFALRIIGRGGFGIVGYIVLALLALAGLGLNFVGYWLIKHGGRSGARKWGFMAVAASTGLAGVLLAVASWTA